MVKHLLLCLVAASALVGCYKHDFRYIYRDGRAIPAVDDGKVCIDADRCTVVSENKNQVILHCEPGAIGNE
jgi:hypothetical protein